MASAPVSLLLSRWPWVAFAASAALLGAAHYAEKVAGLAPCILCLKQREAHWAVLAVSAAAIVVSYSPWKARLGRILLIAIALAFLYGASQAFYHVGAEMKWWEGPAACAASGSAATTSVAEMNAMLDGGPVRIIECSDPTYWPFAAGLTMAGWNLLISLLLLAGSLAAAFRKVPQWSAPSRLAPSHPDPA